MGIEDVVGKPYKLSSSENFDEYMKELGVGLVTRKLGNTVSPTVILKEKDGVYTLETQSTFKNTAITFTPDVEFEEETIDGRKVKSIIKFNGNIMTHEQKGGSKDTTIIREWSDKQMKATMTIGSVVCTRVYDRVD